MVGHICPEAALDGPLARLRDGDPITIDVDSRTLSTESDLSRRSANWRAPRPAPARGVLAKYAYSVESASKGAVTAFPGPRTLESDSSSPSAGHAARATAGLTESTETETALSHQFAAIWLL